VLGGEGLSVGPTASTIMACKLTQQEQAFLAQLETIRRFELAADGALLLIRGPEQHQGQAHLSRRG
jgi:heat shock protein HslJ